MVPYILDSNLFKICLNELSNVLYFCRQKYALSMMFSGEKAKYILFLYFKRDDQSIRYLKRYYLIFLMELRTLHIGGISCLCKFFRTILTILSTLFGSKLFFLSEVVSKGSKDCRISSVSS